MIKLDALLEKNLLPDPVIRLGIRKLLADKIAAETKPTEEAQQQALLDFVEDLKTRGIAEVPEAANEQHYEVPTAFYQLCLGPRLKYSSGYWNESTKDLAASEELMLSKTCERAEIVNGHTILELGCGWGSLTLWMAEKYPQSKITGVSNSRTQKLFIDEEARRRGLTNIEIITADMNVFEYQGSADRVVSVEMFEHMKNYEKLLAKVAGWLTPGGKLFIHIFTHVRFAYHYEGTDPSDWITRYFFAGGMMPADALPLYFQNDLKIEKHWHVDGTHYQKTSEAWLAKMDKNRELILPILRETYGEAQTIKWWSYWRIFYLSCAELWGFKQGKEWIVSHYLFTKPA